MEKEGLKITKVSFSKIPKNEVKKLLFTCLDLILMARKKKENGNSNLLNKNDTNTTKSN